MAFSTSNAKWGTGTIINVINQPSGQVTVQRDGQGNTAIAVAQYANFLVGDRVTLMLLGTQMYATGTIS